MTGARVPVHVYRLNCGARTPPTHTHTHTRAHTHRTCAATAGSRTTSLWRPRCTRAAWRRSRTCAWRSRWGRARMRAHACMRACVRGPCQTLAKTARHRRHAASAAHNAHALYTHAHTRAAFRWRRRRHHHRRGARRGGARSRVHRRAGRRGGDGARGRRGRRRRHQLRRGARVPCVCGGGA